MPTWLTISLISIPLLLLCGRVVYRVGYQDGRAQALEDAHELYSGTRKFNEPPKRQA